LSKSNLSLSRRAFFGLPLAVAAPAFGESISEYRFHHERVLGTSLELIAYAPSEAEANAAETLVLDEIGRLCKILSTYDPSSEISRLNASGGASPRSPELTELLAAYQYWSRRTSGAISAHLGNAAAVWQRAEALQQLPEPAAFVRRAAGPLNVDALGKAYVMEKALAAARRQCPGVRAFLLNVGGDIVISGNHVWPIGVADPAHWHDNADSLTNITLTNCAVATSGIYQRGYRIGGQSYSHILDPRSGRPAQGAASATVIARDCVTANALATALCILPADEGLRLVEATASAACLMVDRDGTERRSAGFARYERPRITRVSAPADWPAGYEVTISLTLKEASGFRVHRPYVAVWVEDANGKLVRDIALWAAKERWLPELHTWWNLNSRSRAYASVSSATKPAGHYRLLWDGRDASGHAVPPGTYRIFVETNREHGNYAKEDAVIEIGAKPASVTLKGTTEFEPVQVEYGPRSVA
jgi:thiamine biosynthesis lipoprotein